MMRIEIGWMEHRSDWRAIAMVATAASSWGLWSLFLRPTGLPATVTSPMLFLLMAAWAMPWALRAEPVVWTRRLVWLLVGNSVFDAINVLTFFAAIERTTVAIAVLTHYAAPVLIALGAPVIDRVRVPGAIAASLVAVAGLALVLEPWREASGVLVGGGLGLISAFAYAGNVFVVRRLATEIGGVRAMTYHAIGAGVLLAPLAIRDVARSSWLLGAALAVVRGPRNLLAARRASASRNLLPPRAAACSARRHCTSG